MVSWASRTHTHGVSEQRGGFSGNKGVASTFSALLSLRTRSASISQLGTKSIAIMTCGYVSVVDFNVPCVSDSEHCCYMRPAILRRVGIVAVTGAAISVFFSLTSIGVCHVEEALCVWSTVGKLTSSFVFMAYIGIVTQNKVQIKQ